MGTKKKTTTHPQIVYEPKFDTSNGDLGTNTVNVEKEKEIVGVKCVEIDGSLERYEDCNFVVGFECPDCGDLYESPDDAAECCNND